ncbi:MAG: inositol monophosphatase family protein [Acidobacteriota bacterium]
MWRPEGRDAYRGCLTVAAETAIRAGELLHERFGRKQEVRYKGIVDLVTEMDHRSQKFILKHLRNHFPGHHFLSEEMTAAPVASDCLWIIDPLDGTTNYAHGFPIYSVSIALMMEGQIVIGAVYCPTLGELYTAQRGEGARLNSRRLRVSTVSKLDRALLATGFPYDIRTTRDNNIAYFTRFIRAAQAVRRAGSAALDLCCLAAGRFDGFWEIKLKSWDVAAALLVVTEAGGVLTDFAGKPVDPLRPDRVVASNGRIHRAMLNILANRRIPHGPARQR